MCVLTISMACAHHLLSSFCTQRSCSPSSVKLDPRVQPRQDRLCLSLVVRARHDQHFCKSKLSQTGTARAEMKLGFLLIPQPPLRSLLQAAKRSSIITPSSRDTDAISEPLFVTKSSYNLFISAVIDHHHHVTCLKLQGSSSGLRFSNSS